jgi:hypothetical protein
MFLLLLGAYKLNVCYGPFWKIAPTPELPLRRHNGLLTCIPGLEGTSVITLP